MRPQSPACKIKGHSWRNTLVLWPSCPIHNDNAPGLEVFLSGKIQESIFNDHSTELIEGRNIYGIT